MSRGLGDVYKRQVTPPVPTPGVPNPRDYRPIIPDPPPIIPDGTTNLGVPPPSIFSQDYNFGDIARDAGARGTTLSEGDARALTDHYLYWRDFYFRIGLSPQQASDLAQAGTDFAGSTQLSFDAPYEWETFNRTHGTELPPTLPLVPIFQFLRKKLK